MRLTPYTRKQIFSNNDGFLIIGILWMMLLLLFVVATISAKHLPVDETVVLKKTAAEMQYLIDAARIYKKNTSLWPSSLDVLITNGYLPASWGRNNSWGNVYSVVQGGGGIQVSTIVPSPFAEGLSRLLTNVAISWSGINATVTSTVIG